MKFFSKKTIAQFVIATVVIQLVIMPNMLQANEVIETISSPFFYVDFDGDLEESQGAEVVVVNDSGIEYAEGAVGQAVKFSSSKSYAQYSNDNLFDKSTGTVEALIKFDDDYGGDAVIWHTDDSRYVLYFDRASDGSERRIIGRAGEEAGRPGVYAFDQNFGKSYYAGIKNTLTKNEWHHVAMAWEGSPVGTVKLYIDGQLMSTSQYKSTSDVSSFRIGNNYGLGMNWGNGWIDELKLYKETRSESQIKSDYNSYNLSSTPANSLVNPYDTWGVFDEGTINYPDVAPPVVSNILVSDNTDTGVLVSWNTNKETKGEVFYRKSGENEWMQKTSTYEKSGRHSVYLENLSPNSKYEYYVVTISSIGHILVSDLKNFVATDDFVVIDPVVDEPVINSIFPTSGLIGSSLTINGQNLYSGHNGKCTLLGIDFGGQYWEIFDGFYPDTFINEKIVITIPDGAKSGDIVLRYYSPDGSFDIKSTKFTVSGTTERTITRISPTSGIVGTKVAIKGKNFGDRCAGRSCSLNVSFGDGVVKRFDALDSFVIDWSDTEINVQVPEGATTDNIKLSYYNGAISYNITGPRFVVKDNPVEQITKINNKAKLLKQDKLSDILTELKQLRNRVKEQEAKIKYLNKLTTGLQKVTEAMKDRINNFITYGVDDNTKRLGAGERAAVMNSYKSAFDKLPDTEEELADAIKIANGRWPSQTSKRAETAAKSQFSRIYKRGASMDNPNDNAAVTLMAYGLRQSAENRNLDSERNGIKIFDGIYGHTPDTTEEWNIMQAITYSGAKR